MDGRPSSRYKCLKQGGLFGPRLGAKTLKRPVASPSSPPAALRRPEPQREPLLARHRVSPKVWRAHQEGGTKSRSRIITGAVARERKRIALGFVWFAGVGSIRSISVNTCRSIQQAQFKFFLLYQVGNVHGHFVNLSVVEFLDILKRSLVIVRDKVDRNSLTAEP